ncbi:MAG: hypothetical protein J6A61_03430 [Clostridia bacterium]|nr:hypothetical protein [Clostridia bacterium]
MQWQRAKTILIVVFFLINVLLVSYLLADRNPSGRQAIADLTEVLSRNKITLNMNTLPRGEKTVFVPEWNSPVLSEKQVEELIDSPVATRDGYTNEDQTCQISISNTRLSYWNSAPNDKKFRKVTAKNVASKLKDAIKTLGISQWVSPIEITQKDDTIVVTYGYHVENRKLFGSQLMVTVSPSGIHKMEGFLGIPDEKNGFSYHLSQLETVLMSLAQTNQNQISISDIELGYYLISYRDALVSQAIPIYAVQTEDTTLFLDARDGVENTARNLPSNEKGATNEEVFSN